MDIEFIIGSNIGWYAVRYYFYNKENIKLLRDRYNDIHLYEDLETLYQEYFAHEGYSSAEEFEIALNRSREAFFENEAR